MDDPITGWALPASMFSLMIGMGLTLTLDDFRRIAKVPGPIIVGTLLQLVAMPVIGFALALAFQLPPMLAAGLVIVAACPGGMMSNMAVHLGRANTALSISLTATATTATLLTLPLWIRATLHMTGGVDANGGAIEIPIFGTAIELGGLTIVPIGIGMALRHMWHWAMRLERPFSLAGTIGIIATLGRDAAARADPPTELLALSLMPAILLCLAAAAIGFVVPLLLRHSISDAVTISVEICLKNGLLGMVVASSAFGVLEPSIPIVLYTSLMIPLSTIALVGHGIYRRALARARHAEQSN